LPPNHDRRPPMDATLETADLRLVPYAPEHLLALMAGTDEFEARFGMPVAPGLREYLDADEVSPEWLARLRSATAADLWDHGFAIVHRAAHCVIGSAGFKGPPDEEGMIEIGYGIAPPFQGRGYATQAVAALIGFASADGRVRLIRAHTLPEENASTRVLTKCGFQFIGAVHDPQDGQVWRWERAAT